MKPTTLARALALTLCSTSMLALPSLAAASEADLMRRLDKLAAELDLVKAELAASRQAAAKAPQTLLDIELFKKKRFQKKFNEFI